MNYTEESAIALYNSQGVVRGYTVYYEEIFEYFQQNLPCETVFLFDNCYSGRATATANLEDLKNVYPDMLRSFDQDLSLTGEYEEGVFTAWETDWKRSSMRPLWLQKSQRLRRMP